MHHLSQSESNLLPRISVILPVFNVEPYISQCIDSLKEQTMTQLEFIFVDDCSTDGSFAAAENWAAQDSRVHIIKNKNNLGPGLSRNRGMEVAKGEYYSFVDPDDWLSPDFYELLYSKAMLTGADIVKGRRARVSSDEQIDLTRTDACNKRILDRQKQGDPLFCIFNAEHQSAIYKSSLLKDKSIRYGCTRNAEDSTFLVRLCSETEDIVFVPEALYFYRVFRMGAATSDYSYPRLCNEIDAIGEQFQWLFDRKVLNGSDDHAARALLTFITRYSIPQERDNLTDGQISYIQDKFVQRLDACPNSFLIRKQYPEIEAMAQHGYAIPVYFEIPELFYRRRCERWSRYLAEHPSEDKVMLDACAVAIDEFLDACRKNAPTEDAPSDVYEYVATLLAPLQEPVREHILGKLRSLMANISVIIPVHNAGSYVAKCIESLKAQTMRELEFVFVDDCSSDGSMGAVEEWASADPRVKILRNERNLGEGGSRNRGLEAACGLYVNTIDPDDWVAPSYYELLWAKAVETSADVVKGTRIKIDEKTGKELKPRSRLNATIDASLAKGEPLYLNLHYEHTTIIFKRSLLDDTVRYGSSPHACDSTFLLRLCMNAESYAAEERACYFYLQREGGATAEYSLERSKNELISLQEQMDSILQKGSIDDYVYEYCAQRFYAYSARFVHAYEREKTSAQDKAQYVSDLKEQMLRLPAHENLYKIVPELYAIVELDMVPAPRLNTDISICKEEISGWMTYILAADATLERPAREKLEDLLVAYCKKRMKAGASQEVLKSETSYMRAGLAGLKARMVFHGIAKKALKKALSHGK